MKSKQESIRAILEVFAAIKDLDPRLRGTVGDPEIHTGPEEACPVTLTGLVARRRLWEQDVLGYSIVVHPYGHITKSTFKVLSVEKIANCIREKHAEATALKAKDEANYALRTDWEEGVSRAQLRFESLSKIATTRRWVSGNLGSVSFDGLTRQQVNALLETLIRGGFEK